MKRPTIAIASATLVAGAVLVAAFGGVAGSAPANPQPDRQSVARHILDPRLKAYMTPATRAAFRTIATGGATCLEQAVGVEQLHERIVALVDRRQQLRRFGASRTLLEENRLQLARSQSELCRAFIELHVAP